MSDLENEQIGQWRDTLDNLLMISSMPGLPAQLRLDGLLPNLRQMRDEMNAALPEDMRI